MSGLWIVAVVVAVLSLGVAVARAAWRRRVRSRRRRPGWIVRRGAARPRHPVVLAHGLLGFDEIEWRGTRRAYFHGIAAHLERLGAVVHRPRVAPAGSIALRAEQLAAFVRGLAADRVNVVAHSMGGLDARYAIARCGVAHRVASLTTIGTPHRGTPLADLFRGLVGEQAALRKALGAAGHPVDAFHDLTRRRLEDFNREISDVAGTAYYSIVGAIASPARANALFLPTFSYLQASLGPNDGLVPAASQEWGVVLHRADADHWAQIGWSPEFDACALYERLARELRGRGF